MRAQSSAAWAATRAASAAFPPKAPPVRAWATSTTPATGQLWAAMKLIYAFGYFERPDVLEAMTMPLACSR